MLMGSRTVFWAVTVPEEYRCSGGNVSANNQRVIIIDLTPLGLYSPAPVGMRSLYLWLANGRTRAR